ncbi:leucine rich adaptor protein 1-like [Spea bombifrons]|uniref:leucine rich adaptor protein 1-like n=1 Tax=Spea bombifrons TaxID=233779 RepID=UPI00234BEAB3|nr:leucine rich adaptor protein 1-like [Spea bombifrons]
MAASSIDLRDIEIKLGRKVPESLVKSLKEDHCDLMDGRDGISAETSAASLQATSVERLENKIQLLKRDMIYLRATDVKLMRQLLIINESIESIKWMMEEKEIITSQGSSLSGSLCSLLESRDTSLQGSCNSLHDYSDGMDEISVGSYLDTLADIVPGHCTPSDFDEYSETQDDSVDRQPLCNDSSNHFEEYYCFR